MCRLFSILFSQVTYFDSSTSDPEMDFSRSLVGHGSRYMWDSVPIYRPRLRFLTRPPSLSLGVYSLSSRTQAFNHERNTVAISPSSSALDGVASQLSGIGKLCISNLVASQTSVASIERYCGSYRTLYTELTKDHSGSSHLRQRWLLPSRLG